VPEAFVVVDAALDLSVAFANGMQDEMSSTTPAMIPAPVPVQLRQGIVN
jgi:hypothetical protein